MQQNVQLTDEELDLIHRLARSENPDASYDRMSHYLYVMKPANDDSRSLCSYYRILLFQNNANTA